LSPIKSDQNKSNKYYMIFGDI